MQQFGNDPGINMLDVCQFWRTLDRSVKTWMLKTSPVKQHRFIGTRKGSQKILKILITQNMEPACIKVAVYLHVCVRTILVFADISIFSWELFITEI
jgi:hypothetical protein